MKTCNTCKWWLLTEDEKTDSIICMYDSDYNCIGNIDPEIRYCRSPKLLFWERPNGTQAAVLDGSEYKADLACTGAFGCVNHEKPPNKTLNLHELTALL